MAQQTHPWRLTPSVKPSLLRYLNKPADMLVLSCFLRFRDTQVSTVVLPCDAPRGRYSWSSHSCKTNSETLMISSVWGGKSRNWWRHAFYYNALLVQFKYCVHVKEWSSSKLLADYTWLFVFCKWLVFVSLRFVSREVVFSFHFSVLLSTKRAMHASMVCRPNFNYPILARQGSQWHIASLPAFSIPDTFLSNIVL